MDIKELRCSEYPHIENLGNPASEEAHHFSQQNRRGLKPRLLGV